MSTRIELTETQCRMPKQDANSCCYAQHLPMALQVAMMVTNSSGCAASPPRELATWAIMVSWSRL